MGRFTQRVLVLVPTFALVLFSTAFRAAAQEPVIQKDPSGVERPCQAELGVIFRIALDSGAGTINRYLGDGFGGAYRFGYQVTDRVSLELLYLDYEHEDASFFNASRGKTVALGAGLRLFSLGRSKVLYRLYTADTRIDIDHVDPVTSVATKEDYRVSGFLHAVALEVPVSEKVSWLTWYIRGTQDGDAEVDVSAFNMGMTYNF